MLHDYRILTKFEKCITKLSVIFETIFETSIIRSVTEHK